MLTYPTINPIAFNLGPLAVHWYGLMYLLGFLLAWLLARYRIAYNKTLNWTKEQVADLIFYTALGLIIGARIGYMVFYDFPTLIAAPLTLFKIWQGGMSFHGGLLGGLLALFLFARRSKKPYLAVLDFIAPLIPLGLAFGRIGNFINGELWGKPTSLPWGMVFPTGGPFARHPSQLYEFFFEGIILFIILWCYSSKPRPTGAVSGIFLMGYALSRIFVEFFRQPDIQLGYLAFGWLTMGQLLSLPMLLIGFYLWWTKRCNPI